MKRNRGLILLTGVLTILVSLLIFNAASNLSQSLDQNDPAKWITVAVLAFSLTFTVASGFSGLCAVFGGFGKRTRMLCGASALICVLHTAAIAVFRFSGAKPSALWLYLSAAVSLLSAALCLAGRIPAVRESDGGKNARKTLSVVFNVLFTLCVGAVLTAALNTAVVSPDPDVRKVDSVFDAVFGLFLLPPLMIHFGALRSIIDGAVSGTLGSSRASKAVRAIQGAILLVLAGLFAVTVIFTDAVRVRDLFPLIVILASPVNAVLQALGLFVGAERQTGPVPAPAPEVSVS